MSPLKITFLGTGTSQGVPVIGCECEVCQSADVKDNRLRTSIMITMENKNIVIDTGPDFRQQMLTNKVKHLEAILYTHAHKDHISGMDDIRAFNYQSGIPMEIYASLDVQEGLKREYHYVFGKLDYPGIPQVNVQTISNKPFKLFDEQIIPIEVLHYKLPVMGFRIRNFTYITDANFICNSELEKVKGTDVLVINALRKEKHISHFNLEEALELIRKIQPQKAYLTHISHLMGKHADVMAELPRNVEIAFDNLEIEVK